MKDLIKQLFTGMDNEVADIAPVAAAGFAITFIGLTIYNVAYLKQPFDMQSFGIGAGAVMAAIATGIGLKNRLETPSQEKKEPMNLGRDNLES